MSQCFRELGVQIHRCTNLPAVRGGDDILQALTELQQTQAEMILMLRMMRTRSLASEANSLAAIENATAKHDASPLAPLRGVQTNEVIPAFPATVGDLRMLSAVEATRLLDMLELPSNGSIAQKRRRLLLKSGISTLALS